MHKIIKFTAGGIASNYQLINTIPIPKLKQIKLTNSSTIVKPNTDRSKWFGMTKVNGLNSKYGSTLGAINAATNTLNDSLVGTEKTGNVSATLNNISDTSSQIAATFNPLGGATNSIGKFTGNLIGGTKNRTAGSGSAAISAISTGLSFAGPVGMAAGFALNLLNGIGGKRVDTLANKTDQIATGFSGTKEKIQTNIDKYSGKKAGLFDFGWAKKGNAAINEAKGLQDLTTSITEEGNLRKSNTAAETFMSQNQNKYSGYSPQLILSRHGSKLPKLEEARKIFQSWNISLEKNDVTKFQLGGKMNLIPEGELHARKHQLEQVDPNLEGQITKKGIPVVTNAEGGIVQTAEIEKEEWTLRKEFTDQLEALYKKYQDKPSDEIAIEAGKLICYELLQNTDDRSGLIKSVK